MKKIICLLASALMIFALTGCDDNSDKTQNKSNSQSESGSKEKPVEYIKLGEIARNDKWEVKILEVSETNIIEGNGKHDEDLTTNEKFVVIKLEMKNISESPCDYSPNDFGVATDKAVYDIDDVAFNGMQNLNAKETVYNKNTSFIGMYDKVNPGMTKNTFIVFNVPNNIDITSGKLGVVGKEVLYMDLK